MDNEPTNDELDFGDSEISTTEQTPEASETPGDTEEQGKSLENQAEAEAVSDDGGVETPAEDTQTEDEALTHFLKSKGIDTEKPESISKDTLYKLGKMAYNSEKQYKQGTQELAELRKQLEASKSQPNDNPDNAGGTQVDLSREVASFVEDKKLTPDEEDKMVEWLAQPVINRQTGQPFIDPTTGQPILRGHQLINGAFTLEDVYNASGCATERIKAEEKAHNEQAKALQEQRIAEERKALQARQIAKRPAGSATISTEFNNKEDDPFGEGLAGDLM